MNAEHWGAAISYYKACWVDFSPEALGTILTDDVKFLGVKGRDDVVKMFKVHFFDRVDISKTKIHNFKIELGGIPPGCSLADLELGDCIASIHYDITQTLLNDPNEKNLQFHEYLFIDFKCQVKRILRF